MGNPPGDGEPPRPGAVVRAADRLVHELVLPTCLAAMVGLVWLPVIIWVGQSPRQPYSPAGDGAPHPAGAPYPFGTTVIVLCMTAVAVFLARPLLDAWRFKLAARGADGVIESHLRRTTTEDGPEQDTYRVRFTDHRGRPRVATGWRTAPAAPPLEPGAVVWVRYQVGRPSKVSLQPESGAWETSLLVLITGAFGIPAGFAIMILLQLA